jgi:hypothetical protein
MDLKISEQKIRLVDGDTKEELFSIDPLTVFEARKLRKMSQELEDENDSLDIIIDVLVSKGIDKEWLEKRTVPQFQAIVEGLANPNPGK